MGTNKQQHASTVQPESGGLPRILFALQVVGHPRDSKRINMLQEVGLEVEAIAFERPFHKGRQPGCPVQTVGKIEHGHYMKRAGKMLAALPTIRRAIKSHDMVYASGTDMALICRLSSLGLGRPIILETGDVRSLQTAKSIKGRMVRAVDKWLTNSCSLLVATAPGFVDGYYRQWLKVKTPALIIENKLEAVADKGPDSLPTITPMEGTPLVDRPLRIGYFGLLRCDRSWQVLECLASRHPQEFEIIVAGIPAAPENLAERAINYANIDFRGKYRSPQDLSSLYNSVDIVWACYPFPKLDDHNWRWARTNRFYESCHFNKPMIVLERSGDAYEVEHHGLGTAVKNIEIEEIVQALTVIKPEDLSLWQENMAALPRDVYTYTTETEDLKRAIMEIAAGRGVAAHG